MTNPIFSVVVCTLNRKEALEKNIESLLDQTFDYQKFEIIVVDDGSNDGTANYLKTKARKTKEPKIRVIMHKNKGLAHSRNIAVKKARGEFMAFIDDDAVASRNWLKNAYGCISSVNPKPQGVTGPVKSYYKVKKPIWFKDEYVDDIKGIKERFLKTGEAFSGPNMILNKEIIKKYGGFDELVDMKGALLMLGEETKLFERIWKNNIDKKILYYSPQIIVNHLIHPFKLTISYTLKRWFATGQSYYLRHKRSGLLEKTGMTFRIVGFTIISTLLAVILIPFYRRYQNWLIERIGPILFCLGFITSLARISYNMKQYNRI